VQVTRGRAQTATAKKYDGLELEWGAGPEAHQLRLTLYDDTFWGLVFSMRGAALDAAVDALRQPGSARSG
jgi:hypothetical protein